MGLDIEEIYKIYPRHRDKRHALETIQKAIVRIMAGETGVVMTRQQAFDYLLQKSRDFANSYAGQKGQLTPYPATWMNRGGYMDDPQEWEYISPSEEKVLNQRREANIGVWKPQ